MDPENPPRRTKPDQEPVTIDLQATQETPETARAALDASRAEAEHHAEATADPSVADVMHREEPSPSSVTDGDETARAEAAAAAFTEEPASRPDTVYAAPQPARSSRSGALAAGILGGLIALAGAGVLQYAGVIPAIGPGATTGSGRDLAAEVDALKAEVGSPDAGDRAALDQRIAALEQTIGGATNTSDTDTLKAQLDSLTQELAAVRSSVADQQRTTQSATSELSTRIEEAEKKLDEPASDVQLARAIAVTALKTAIDRGGPFLAELDQLKSISPEDPAVAGLADIASRGVSSRVELTRAFPETADAMLSAIRGADPNQGVFSRLIDSATSAVRVRPVGSVEGTGPEAVVARIEDRLANGDLKAASLEWDGLPQPAKDAGAAFREKLDTRIKVEGLIDAAVAGAASGSTTVKQG
jgi:hypothetical protein